MEHLAKAQKHGNLGCAAVLEALAKSIISTSCVIMKEITKQSP